MEMVIMIYGTFSVSRVNEESVCRTTQDYQFTELGVYKVHATALMPNVQFDESLELPDAIDGSIFLNDEETLPDFEYQLNLQNYLTTKYIGRAPLEWYDEDTATKMGRQFLMVCRGGNPGESYRVFGTEDAIRGYNRNANDNVALPGGGDK